MNSTTASKTPGYNVRLSIRFTTDRNGRVRATRYSSMNQRWFPVKVSDAELWIAQDLADRV